MPAELSGRYRSPVYAEAAMEGGLLCPPNQVSAYGYEMRRQQPQWRAGCYARRTAPCETTDTSPLSAAMEGGLLCPPNVQHQLPLRPSVHAAMEGGLLCPPNPLSRPRSAHTHRRPQWRAGCYARRTGAPLGTDWSINESRNGGRAVMPAEQELDWEEYRDAH